MEDRKRIRRPKYSDIDMNRWKEYEDILTDTWWDMKAREKTNGHSFDYHGNFIPQIPNQIFRRYTRENDIVIDWFLGSGTSAIEAINLDRRLIGVELQKKMIDNVSRKISGIALNNSIRLINGDSASPKTKDSVEKALVEMGSTHAQLAVLHPPYADIIKFSKSKSDLSNCQSTDNFLAQFYLVAKNAYETLERGRFAVLVIGDKYAKGELIPLGFRCMEVMEKASFHTKSIIVKNIEGNEKGKGKDTNLWRYRALYGGFYIFKHEYVMVFYK